MSKVKKVMARNASMLMKTPTLGTQQLKIRMSSAGIHLFNRRTGMNILLDEVRLPSNLWSTAPRQVSIALTNACDLECQHCYAPKNPAVLAFDRLISWLVELDTNGCIGVGFGGGEPTLYPRLAELFSYAAETTNLALTMTTHAHRLSDQLLDELSGNLHFARVSMDGVGDTYEEIRNRPFDFLIKRIKALSKITPFGINFVVNSKTIGDLDAAVQIAIDLGAVELLLLPEERTMQAMGVGEETIQILQRWVSAYREKLPLSISESRSEGFLVCNPLETETGVNSFAHIDASGMIKTTSYDLNGIMIENNSVISSLRALKAVNREKNL